MPKRHNSLQTIIEDKKANWGYSEVEDINQILEDTGTGCPSYDAIKSLQKIAKPGELLQLFHRMRTTEKESNHGIAYRAVWNKGFWLLYL